MGRSAGVRPDLQDNQFPVKCLFMRKLQAASWWPRS